MPPQSHPPLVSVVMPVLNPSRRLFLEAVQSVLDQSLREIELIIVEDPSPQPAGDLLGEMRDLRIRHFLNSQRTSLPEQINRGLSEARALLVARMDADDICEPDRLLKQFEFFQSHPEVSVLGSQISLINEQGVRLGYRAYPLDHDSILDAMRRYDSLAHPSVMFKTDVVRGIGGYPLRKDCEDYELWSRLALKGIRFANHHEPLLRYRVHAAARKARTIRRMIRSTLEIKKKYWMDKMDMQSRVRMWTECFLLLLPPSLVLWLFVRTQFRSKLPVVPEQPQSRR